MCEELAGLLYPEGNSQWLRVPVGIIDKCCQEEKAPGRPHCGLAVLKGCLQERFGQTFQQDPL